MGYASCTLHIGMEKTGTTTIQGALAASRKALRRHGIVYSRAMGRDNHTELVAHARDDDRTDNQRKRALARTGLPLEAFRADVRRRLLEEAEAAPAGARLLLSNEHLQSRLTNTREKARLRALLGEVAGRIDVHLYLRRQDKVAVSLYGTRLRAGSISQMAPVFPKLAGGLPYQYDYARICEEWAEVFGRDRLHVRVFDPARLRDGDVWSDFRDWIGLDPALGLGPAPRLNESISYEAQLLLTELNRTVPMFVDDRPNPLRRDVGRRLDAIAPGRGRRPARAQAEAFLAACAASNARLFETFDVEGGPFEAGFEGYPEDGAQAADPREMARIAAELYRDVVAELLAERDGG